MASSKLSLFQLWELKITTGAWREKTWCLVAWRREASTVSFSPQESTAGPCGVRTSASQIAPVSLHPYCSEGEMSKNFPAPRFLQTLSDIQIWKGKLRPHFMRTMSPACFYLVSSSANTKRSFVRCITARCLSFRARRSVQPGSFWQPGHKLKSQVGSATGKLHRLYSDGQGWIQVRPFYVPILSLSVHQTLQIAAFMFLSVVFFNTKGAQWLTSVNQLFQDSLWLLSVLPRNRDLNATVTNLTNLLDKPYKVRVSDLQNGTKLDLSVKVLGVCGLEGNIVNITAYTGNSWFIYLETLYGKFCCINLTFSLINSSGPGLEFEVDSNTQSY